MKNKLTRCALLIAMLALTAHLSFVAPSALAQNANSSTMTETAPPKATSNPCRHRCLVTYRKCLRGAGTPGRRQACARRYRACTLHCIQ
jgi:hypothetical protein